jgi:hypothetical protein
LSYISFPIESDVTEILADAYASIKSVVPEWRENDANLDTWILQSVALEVSDLRELAKDVPDTIFRYFGSSILNIPPIEAVAATGTSTWTMADTLGHTIPDGTYVTIPNNLGESIPFQTVGDVTVAPGSSTTAVGGVLLRAIEMGSEGSGLGGPGVVVTLIDTLIFVNAVTLTAATTGGVDAETASEYNDRLSQRAQLLSTRPILPRDFAILAQDIAGVARSVGIDGYNPFHNLLSANAASVEVDATPWAVAANCTIARSTAQAADGAASLALTSVAAGNMSALGTVAASVAVSPGDTITGLASFRSAVSARSCRCYLNWYTSGDVLVSQTPAGASVTDSTTGWTQAFVTGVAPATAAKVRFDVEVVAAGAGAEVHYVDKMSLRRGTGQDWVIGGTVETGVERVISVAAVDELGNNVSTPVKAAVDTLLQSNREITFLVYVIDPVRTAVAVTFTAKAITGYDPILASANAVADLQTFLNPTNWGVDPGVFSTGSTDTWIDKNIVRYSEIAQVISNAEGIDYWTAITIGIQGGTLAAADLTIPGPASIATAGTITPTVT